MAEVVLIHRKKTQPQMAPLAAHPALSSGDWLHAETCLRELSFGLKSDLTDPEVSADDLDLYEGAELYQFCLQMACGLFSPIVGETEVFGQFRSFFAPEKVSQLSWSGLAESFSQKIFSDVKALRQTHLIGMGSQSYGSFARRFVNSEKSVLVIGGGQLAQEILPWVGKQNKNTVDVLVRRVDQVSQLEKSFTQTKAHTWETFSGEVHSVVVAAPISSEQLEELIAAKGLRIHRLLDLREESGHDSLSHLAQSYCTLREVFEEMEKTKAKLGPVLTALKSDIEKRVQSQVSRASYRPFGWDDLCA